MRVPVKAGARDVQVAFIKQTVGAGRDRAPAVPATLPRGREHRGDSGRAPTCAASRSPVRTIRRARDSRRAGSAFSSAGPIRLEAAANGAPRQVAAGDRGERSGCARTILRALARRAYRRPVADADVEPLLAFYRDGRQDGGFDDGIERGLRRLLVSPEFLLRIESDPPGRVAGPAVPDQRSRARVAPVVFPVEQHSRRGAAEAGGAEAARRCRRSWISRFAG